MPMSPNIYSNATSVTRSVSTFKGRMSMSPQIMMMKDMNVTQSYNNGGRMMRTTGLPGSPIGQDFIISNSHKYATQGMPKVFSNPTAAKSQKHMRSYANIPFKQSKKEGGGTTASGSPRPQNTNNNNDLLKKMISQIDQFLDNKPTGNEPLNNP